MRKTKFNTVFELLQENPTMDRAELAEKAGVSRDTVDVYFKRFKDRGMIQITNDGNITFLANTSQTRDYKRDIYEFMLDKYIEDFEKAEFYTERVEVRKLILRLLEKL